MCIHYGGLMPDKEGTGKQLIFHSHIELKEDATEWLKTNGRLPAPTTAEYFQEVNDYEQRISALESELKQLKNASNDDCCRLF